jgi:predicted ATPase
VVCTGHVHSAADEADAQRTRQLIALGVRHLVALATQSGPLVTVIDGVQWSDRQSLEPFTEFLRSGEHVPLLALFTTRPDDRLGALIEGLVRVELKGLSPENQVRLLQARLAVVEGVAQACADLLPRAGGNPFFLLEMVDTLLERGQTPLATGLLWVPVVVAALALLMLAMPQVMARLLHRRAVRAPG